MARPGGRGRARRLALSDAALLRHRPWALRQSGDQIRIDVLLVVLRSVLHLKHAAIRRSGRYILHRALLSEDLPELARLGFVPDRLVRMDRALETGALRLARARTRLARGGGEARRRAGREERRVEAVERWMSGRAKSSSEWRGVRSLDWTQADGSRHGGARSAPGWRR